jgi:hypothetical protein
MRLLSATHAVTPQCAAVIKTVCYISNTLISNDSNFLGFVSLQIQHHAVIARAAALSKLLLVYPMVAIGSVQVLTSSA